jgi:membrane-associated phospholipid phosphatase
MPSGHAQQILFTLVFLLLVRPSWIVFWICLTIGLFGLIERYVNRRHTLEQLFVGGVIGVAFAMVSVFVIRKMLFFLEKEKV